VHKESVKDERPNCRSISKSLETWNASSGRPYGHICLKLKSNDFDQVKRVFYNDLTMASPYNTYRYGTPPGPIAMPDITALEAVINPEKNDFIYFCASVDFGYHEFAATLKEHNVNAKNIQLDYCKA
jgi:UPF0755 protein